MIIRNGLRRSGGCSDLFPRLRLRLRLRLRKPPGCPFLLSAWLRVSEQTNERSRSRDEINILCLMLRCHLLSTGNRLADEMFSLSFTYNLSIFLEESSNMATTTTPLYPFFSPPQLEDQTGATISFLAPCESFDEDLEDVGEDHETSSSPRRLSKATDCSVTSLYIQVISRNSRRSPIRLQVRNGCIHCTACCTSCVQNSCSTHRVP